MLKNFVILPSEQVPAFPPFQGALCVTDGTCDRPEGFDFEEDGDLVVDLKRMGELQNGESLFYLPEGDTPQQVVYDDCGRILAIRLVRMEMGREILPPRDPRPDPSDIVRGMEITLHKEHSATFTWASRDNKDFEEVHVFLTSTEMSRKRAWEDALMAELVGRWQLIDRIVEELDGSEWGGTVISHVGEMLTEHGFVLRSPDEMEDA